MHETSFQIRTRMSDLETEYSQLLLQLREYESEYQKIVAEYHAAKNRAWQDDGFKQMLKQFSFARNSSTVIMTLVDSWVDANYSNLATRYASLLSAVSGLREMLRRYEPLIDLVRQQAILSSVEAKIAGGYA